MKRKMITLFSLIILLVVCTFTIGLLLPKQQEFVRTKVFSSPPEKVFQLVTDVANQTSWRNDVSEIKIIDSTTWTEVPKKGTALTFRIKQKVENQKFEIEIIEPKSFNGYWVGTFQPNGSGTSVEFKEVVIIENPFFRLMSRMFVDLNKTMDDYNENLKRALGE